MIIGNGLIAKAFVDNISHDDYIIFASGVSDSNETDVREFIREHSLLRNTIEQNPNKKLIYFTSVLAETISNAYYIHKNSMEKTIKLQAKDYIIYRIPQLIGKTGNKFNLVHYLKEDITNEKDIVIYKDIIRSILDVDDLVDLVDYSKDKINRDYVDVSYIEKISVLGLAHKIAARIGKYPLCKIVEGKGDLENWYFENSTIVIEWIFMNVLM